MNIKQIPLDELEKDKQESLEDIIICKKAIRHNVKYSGGSIQDRLDTKKRIVEKIDKELSRRILDVWIEAFTEANARARMLIHLKKEGLLDE